MENISNHSVAIIGGGAAGLMAAATLVESGFEGEIILFEKNSYLGAKVLISGGGRCNVTTGISDVKKLLQNYPRGSKFLMTAFYQCPPPKVIEWFEEHGVPLKTEEDLRVFPQSNQGKDIVRALESTLRDGQVEIHFHRQVTDLTKTADSFQISFKNEPAVNVAKVVLACGGNAYHHTGSTGDGYHFARKLGHRITPLAPSLHSFKVSEPWVRAVAGVSFEQAELRLSSAAGESSYVRKGPFMFTHYGISGPAVFALSSMSAHEPFDANQPLKLSLCFFPEERPEKFEERFSALAQQHGAKTIVNFLDFFLPKSLCEIFCDSAKVSPDLKVARLSREQRKAFMSLFFNFPLRVVGRGAGDEFVTAGGVDTSEVDSRTMESKLCPGLFFAGEILDVDGFTGGFNLQAAWATGRLAGESIIAQFRKNL